MANDKSLTSILIEKIPTKGPWTVTPGGAVQLGTLYFINNTNGQGMRQADAALIAAAPDLLRALKRWQEFAETNGYTDTDYLTGTVGWVSETNAAIAKAEGQS